MVEVPLVNPGPSHVVTFKVSSSLVFLVSSSNVVNDFISGLTNRFQSPFDGSRLFKANFHSRLSGSSMKYDGFMLSFSDYGLTLFPDFSTNKDASFSKSVVTPAGISGLGTFMDPDDPFSQKGLFALGPIKGDDVPSNQTINLSDSTPSSKSLVFSLEDMSLPLLKNKPDDDHSRSKPSFHEVLNFLDQHVSYEFQVSNMSNLLKVSQLRSSSLESENSDLWRQLAEVKVENQSFIEFKLCSEQKATNFNMKRLLL